MRSDTLRYSVTVYRVINKKMARQFIKTAEPDLYNGDMGEYLILEVFIYE